ncbi:hypothetical protein Ancab_038834 [Ancistrocladus abbreviatus]
MLTEERLPPNPANARSFQQHIFSLLHHCSSIKKLSQIHVQIIANGFSQKNFIIVKLISLYTAYSYLCHAEQVFKELERPSTTAWNQLIRGNAHSETPQKSVELYARMLTEDSEPDGYTYSYTLSGCSRSGLLREGEQIHGRVLSNGYYSNVFVRTNLVNLYSLCGGDDGLDNAYKLFNEMPEKNAVTWNSLLAGYIRCGDVDGALRLFDEIPDRSVVSWTTMVSGCARRGRCRQALSLFSEMRRAGIELDQVALISALSACAELGDLYLGRWIHSYVNKAFLGRREEIHVPLHNALMHMYSSCGMLEDAYGVFKEMPRRSIVSWTSMIIGYAKHGYGEKALRLFQWMQSLRVGEVRPDAITFIGVLCACSHVGYVDEGRRYFKEMTEKWAVEPRIEHYGCMVDLLSRAGFLDEALRLMESMPMKPNAVIWGALLGGCRTHKNIKLAYHAAQNLMLELDTERAMGYLVLLSNVYAMAKRWDDVAIVRQKMIELDESKPPGRSWVQINGVIHDFVAGDWNHKHALTIYEVLNEVTRQVLSEKYEHRMHENSVDVVGVGFTPTLDLMPKMSLFEIPKC